MLVSERAVRAMDRWEPWESFQQARTIQERLAGQVNLVPFTQSVRYILAVDCAFQKKPDRIIAGAVVWDRQLETSVYQSVRSEPLTTPYVPGYLSFREAPAILRVLMNIHHGADLLVVDGQGLAHPRHFGLACHLGVLLDMPAIGVGKSRLYGVHGPVPVMRGAWVPLWDPRTKKMIGTVIRTQTDVKPVFASPGHRIDFMSATRLVLNLASRYRLPEPQRWADRLVRSVRSGGRVSG